MFIIALALLLFIYIVTVALWPLQPVRATLQYTNDNIIAEAQLVNVSLPAYGQSAVYVPGYGVLQKSGNDVAAPIASITKIITALTVLNKKPLGSNAKQDTITFSEADVTSYNDYLSQQGTVGPVVPGQSISREAMLTIMLVSSANNYADRLAIDAFGSLESYISAANDYLRTQGLTNTAVADASGFSPNSISTAVDLTQLGELALQNPVIAAAVDTEIYTLEGYGTFRSTNILLSRDDAVGGIKTGTTDEAGSCLLYAKTVTIDDEEITIIGASMGAPNGLQIAADADIVFDTTASNFTQMQFFSENEPIGSYQSPWGAETAIYAQNQITDIFWSGKPVVASSEAVDIQAGTPNKEVGSLGIQQDALTIAEVILITKEPLEKPSLWWRITNPSVLF